MKNKVKYNPFVSIICVTYNRRPFIPFLLQCIRNQDYPASRYEVIIVDDGTDKVKDIITAANIPQVKYFELAEKMTLGKKRNYSHTLIDPRAQYITYFDDDDYHHPSRISYSVEMLVKNPNAMCAGASEIFIFFKHLKQMVKFGPYGPNHATAGTFTFRVELLNSSSYYDGACLAEEKFFLKDYTVPLIQLDPLKTILVVSHAHNTFDKKKLLDNPNPFVNLSSLTIESFITRKNESKILKFFVEEVDNLLSNYEFGETKYKPDVLNQIKEIEKERDGLQSKIEPIYKKVEGGKDVLMSSEEIVNLIHTQYEEIKKLKDDQISIYMQVEGSSDVLMSKHEITSLINNQNNGIKKLQDEMENEKKRYEELQDDNCKLKERQIEMENEKKQYEENGRIYMKMADNHNVLLSTEDIVKIISQQKARIDELMLQLRSIKKLEELDE